MYHGHLSDNKFKKKKLYFEQTVYVHNKNRSPKMYTVFILYTPTELNELGVNQDPILFPASIDREESIFFTKCDQ